MTGIGVVEKMNDTYHYIRQLYLERLTGMISEEDDARLQDLLLDDAYARTVWEKIEEESRSLNAHIVLDGIDTEEELQDWKKRVGDQEDDKQPMLKSWPWRRWAAVAAVVAGLCVGYYFVGNTNRDSSPSGKLVANPSGVIENNRVTLLLGNGESVTLTKDQKQQFAIEGGQLESSGKQLQYGNGEALPVGLNKLIIPAKEDFGITLSDGTRVFLNAQSKLQFPFYFSGNSREIYIDGEAYLEVAKDSQRPFIVHTPLADIRVTGTRFNINTYEKGTVRTSLVEGRVSVNASEHKPLELLPGMETVYAKDKGFTTQRFDASDVLAWRDGVAYFHDRKLGELTGLIGRWFGMHVVFERGHLVQHPVSGLLEKGHLTEFLDDLRETSGINYAVKDTVLYLR